MRGAERLHSLDSVRAGAMLAGIVLHVSWAFLPGLAATPWTLADRSSSVILGIVFYTIHNFRMPLFFVIAGFFARVLLHRRGLGPFISNRVQRIFMPLAVGWIALYPLIWAAFAWPVMKSNGFVIPSAPSFFNRRWSFPFAHLWFLYYLLLMYATALAGRWLAMNVMDRRNSLRPLFDRWVAQLVAGRWAPLLLAVLPAMSLFLNAEWIRWFGIATPDTSLRPAVPATVGFGIAFSLGWLLNRQVRLLQHWERRWRTHLAAALALTALSLRLTGVAPTYTPAAHDATTLIYAICYMTASWNWSFAILGLAAKYCSAPSSLRRYVVDASYWVYLIHLPVVLALQAALQDQPWHWSLKFSIILSATLVVLFASYHFVVRFSMVDRVLNGRATAPLPRYSVMAGIDPSR